METSVGYCSSCAVAGPQTEEEPIWCDWLGKKACEEEEPDLENDLLDGARIAWAQNGSKTAQSGSKRLKTAPASSHTQIGHHSTD